MKEVGKRFCPSIILTSILQSALTYPKLRDILEGIPASDIQNKTVIRASSRTQYIAWTRSIVTTRILFSRYSNIVLFISNVGGKLLCLMVPIS